MAHASDLSPAAQAVLNAFLHDWPDNPLNSDRHCLAVALCAVADQLFTDWDGMCCAEHLKAIAAELENTSPPS
jgi:hypothetical protein